VIGFTVPDPNDCLVQVSTDPAFGSFVNDTNNALFTGSQKCNRAGSVVNGNDVVFVIGLRTSQKATDRRFHSRALKCNTVHYYRIISQFQQDSASPRIFQTRNPPLGALYPEPPPFDPTLTAFGNYAWPEFDWSDPTKSVIEPLTGLEIKPFTRPGTRTQFATNSQWSTPFDVHSAWTNANNAATAGGGFATGAGGPTDYLFLPLPWFKSDQGPYIGGWSASYGLDDLLVRPYGSATTVDGTHNVISLCLSIDSGQTCASSSFTVTLTGSSGAKSLVPAAILKPIFANWNLVARQCQKVPVTGNVTVSGSNVTLLSPVPGQYFDVTMARGSKVFIAGAASMAPTPCPNDMCTVASVRSATQITIAESCSTSRCPVNQIFTAATFGLRVAKTTSTGSVSVSFGVDVGYSAMSDAGVNGGSSYCNNNSVTVTVDRAGNALTQSLRGYLCTSGGGDLLLLIPSNADGTPRGEVRLLSALRIPSFTGNGLTSGNATLNLSGFDPTIGNKFSSAPIVQGSTYLFTGIYDTTVTDGDGRPCDYREWPLGGTRYANEYLGDCVRWTNLINPFASPARDLRSQIVNAYQTGRNVLGATVSATPHPGFDLSFMVTSPYVYTDAGLVTVTLFNGPNFTSNGLTVVGTFELTTGVLVHVTDTWSQLPARWGNCHGCAAHTEGTRRDGAMNILTDDGNGHALNGAWQTNITQVNRASFGSTPVWDTNTALAYNEGYTCPTLPQALVDIGGSGSNCIQVKISSEACSHIPSATFYFLDGTTEVQKFPCTTNVGGTLTVPTGASTWSKLQDIIVNDWVQDRSFTYLGSTERLVVATKTVNAANDIDMWLIRWVGCRGAKFPDGLRFGGPTGSCEFPSPALSAHTNGWSLRMTVPFSYGTDAGTQFSVLNPLSITTPWIAGNFHKAQTHGVTGASPTDGNVTSVTPDTVHYDVQYDQPFTSQIYTPYSAGSIIQNPGFATNNSTGPPVQNYVSLTQYKAAPRERVWALDYRHINPAAGNGAEADSAMGNGQVAYTITLQSGTTQTYQLATDGAGRDSLSSGAPDPKRLPMIGSAGRYLLKDYSSPATGNVFGDFQTYGWCRAYKVNECRTGSAVGGLYVSVPSATTTAGSCYSNQYEKNIPCIFSNTPVTANVMQFDISQADATGSRQRRLGYGLAGPLRQYQFNNARATPDGKYMIFPGNWVDGQRRELMIAELPPWPNVDAYDRTTFVPVPVNVDADPNAPNARVRFGYAENGPPESLFCTTRQDSCSTEPPTLAPTDPYSFMSETRTAQTCSNGCTIRIPGISERVVYYVIEWLSSTGTVVRSSSLHADVVAGAVLSSKHGYTIGANMLLRNAAVR